jgi:hypothetical protein
MQNYVGDSDSPPIVTPPPVYNLSPRQKQLAVLYGFIQIVLVAGIATGVVLVGQNQDIRNKAVENINPTAVLVCSSLVSQLSANAPLRTDSTVIRENWGGLNEKWFLDKNNDWYYLYPDPANNEHALLYRWRNGLKEKTANVNNDEYLGSYPRGCYDLINNSFVFPMP